jgi:hypothetical protein
MGGFISLALSPEEEIAKTYFGADENMLMAISVIGMVRNPLKGFAKRGAKKTTAYSVAFETKIPKRGEGTRGSHFTDANRSLLKEMAKDPAFAKMMEDLGIEVGRLDRSPAGWSWHHVPNEPGTLQLVPMKQHQEWTTFFHPNKEGGFKIWGDDY